MMKRFGTKKSEYTVIIGCGRLGASLAGTLSDNGGNVLIMDKNRESFRRLSPTFGGLSVVANGTDLDALREANLQRASAVIAVTDSDNTNIMVAQMARDLFHVEQVIARLFDPERETVYQQFGIKTFCPAILSAEAIDKLLVAKEA